MYRPPSFITINLDVKHAMAVMEQATGIRQVCTIAAAEIKRVSGFDKVMDIVSCTPGIHEEHEDHSLQLNIHRWHGSRMNWRWQKHSETSCWNL